MADQPASTMVITRKACELLMFAHRVFVAATTAVVRHSTWRWWFVTLHSRANQIQLQNRRQLLFPDIELSSSPQLFFFAQERHPLHTKTGCVGCWLSGL